MIHEPPEPQDITLQTWPPAPPARDWRLRLPHPRRRCLFAWVTRGQGTALAGGARLGIGAQSVVFVPAGHLASVAVARRGFAHVLELPETARAVLPSEPAVLRVADRPATGQLAALLDMINREQSQRPPLFRQASQALADLVAIWLHRQIPAGAAPPGPVRGARGISRALCDWLASDLFDPGLKVPGIAGILGVSAAGLARACRSELGTTPARLLAERRLFSALCLLERTDVPINRIGAHLGFASAAGFSRFVQAQTGASPTAIRQESKTARQSGRCRHPAGSPADVAFGQVEMSLLSHGMAKSIVDLPRNLVRNARGVCT